MNLLFSPERGQRWLNHQKLAQKFGQKLSQNLGRKFCIALGLGICLAASNVNAKDEELTQRVGKLERALNNRGLLDLSERIEGLQAEVQSLRGQLEDQQYTIERLRKSQQQAYVDLDRRMQESLNSGSFGSGMNHPPNDGNGEPPLSVYQPGEQPDVAGTPAAGIDVQVQQPVTTDGFPTFPAGDSRVDAASSANALENVLQPPANAELANLGRPNNGLNDGLNDQILGSDESSISMPDSAGAPRPTADQAYRDAFGLLKAGKYDESIEAFNLFLLDYPNSEYSDNAQYWLGETYFVKQEYAPAIDEYRKLIANHPASKKQSHALLKIGYSFQRLGELDKAQAVLKDLTVRYPGTTAARLAQERIQQILAASP